MLRKGGKTVAAGIVLDVLATRDAEPQSALASGSRAAGDDDDE